jgi:hypothetical protein
MCFTKTPKVQINEENEAKVVRHEANAELTKTSKDKELNSFTNNLRTSPIGLVDNAPTQKKTLLGE